MNYAPFDYFINGGIAFNEKLRDFKLDQILISDNALEIDNYVIDNIFGIEKPQYINLLESFGENNQS